jgi:hypothetical protein
MVKLKCNEVVIGESPTLRGACRTLLADPSPHNAGGTVLYQIEDATTTPLTTTSMVANLGREFHVFGSIGLPENLVAYQQSLNAAMVAEGGIPA